VLTVWQSEVEPEMVKLPRQLLSVSMELTDVGRIVARFDSRKPSSEELDKVQRGVDAQIEGVVEELEKYRGAVKSGGLAESWVQLSEQLREIEVEWKAQRGNGGEPEWKDEYSVEKAAQKSSEWSRVWGGFVVGVCK
jgi:hypothetical protein